MSDHEYYKFDQEHLRGFIKKLENISIKLRSSFTLNSKDTLTLNILKKIIPTFNMLQENPHMSLDTKEDKDDTIETKTEQTPKNFRTNSRQMVLRLRSPATTFVHKPEKKEDDEDDQAKMIERELLSEEVLASLRKTIELSGKIGATEWYTVKETSDSESEDSDSEEEPTSLEI